MNAPVTFLVSAIMEPRLPNRHPTWLGEIKSLAVIGVPVEDGNPVSTNLLKTSMTAFCAGEFCDSRVYNKKRHKIKRLNYS